MKKYCLVLGGLSILLLLAISSAGSLLDKYNQLEGKHFKHAKSYGRIPIQ